MSPSITVKEIRDEDFTKADIDELKRFIEEQGDELWLNQL